MARLVASKTPRLSLPATVAPVPAAPVPLPAAPALSSPAAGGAAEAALDADSGLLRRGEGRSSTVLTGWTGLLTPGFWVPRRKSLLGE
ncbi:hypothetical protein [Oleisolibacter albus]|uniref:hypothetical protein n=1 Tax=Oleisolibacter albus TaxID=2171757 RepID=UPI000DF27FD2|nr:hypothetical protein [Oleisolibacter albus]